MNTKTCEYCGAKFTPNKFVGNRQRFCREECSRAWWNDNRDKGKKYHYVCKNCGKPYTTLHIERDQYCSRKCAFEDREQWQCGDRVDKVCPVCGKVRIAYVSAEDYCSEECKRIAHQFVCEICGRLTDGVPGQMYCSEDCKKEAARVRTYEMHRLEYIEDPRVGTCKECGGLFCPLYGSWLRAFCGDECRASYFSRVGKATRRARIRGAERVDSIDPMQVFERAGWKCYICGQRTPQRLRGTIEDNAPELDHVVALAAGGSHTYDNVACCCRRCNQAKHDLTLEEYATHRQCSYW